MTKTLLCQLVRAQRVEILLGSGTLANDVIAAQLSLLAAPGIILNNGEFGSRLVDHARRFGLSFQAIEIEWGGGFDRDQVRQIIVLGCRANITSEKFAFRRGRRVHVETHHQSIDFLPQGPPHLVGSVGRRRR